MTRRYLRQSNKVNTSPHIPHVSLRLHPPRHSNPLTINRLEMFSLRFVFMSPFNAVYRCASCLVLSCLVLSCLIRLLATVACLVLSCLIRFLATVACLVLSCLVLSCSFIFHLQHWCEHFLTSGYTESNTSAIPSTVATETLDILFKLII